MPREPFASRVIRPAGDDPVPGPRAVAFRTPRLSCDLDGPPANGLVRADAEAAGAAFAAPIRTADAGGRRVHRARAPHQQAAPL